MNEHVASKYLGVSGRLSCHNRSWYASIKWGGRNLHLGYYSTEEEAARAFDKAAVRLRGSATRLNYSYEDYFDSAGILMPDAVVDYKLKFLPPESLLHIPGHSQDNRLDNAIGGPSVPPPQSTCELPQPVHGHFQDNGKDKDVANPSVLPYLSAYELQLIGPDFSIPWAIASIRAQKTELISHAKPSGMDPVCSNSVTKLNANQSGFSTAPSATTTVQEEAKAVTCVAFSTETYAEIQKQLPDGASLESALPDESHMLVGVLYSILNEHLTGSGVWTGTKFHDCGLYSTCNDAKVGCMAVINAISSIMSADVPGTKDTTHTRHAATMTTLSCLRTEGQNLPTCLAVSESETTPQPPPQGASPLPPYCPSVEVTSTMETPANFSSSHVTTPAITSFPTSAARGVRGLRQGVEIELPQTLAGETLASPLSTDFTIPASTTFPTSKSGRHEVLVKGMLTAEIPGNLPSEHFTTPASTHLPASNIGGQEVKGLLSVEVTPTLDIPANLLSNHFTKPASASFPTSDRGGQIELPVEVTPTVEAPANSLSKDLAAPGSTNFPTAKSDCQELKMQFPVDVTPAVDTVPHLPSNHFTSPAVVSFPPTSRYLTFGEDIMNFPMGHSQQGPPLDHKNIRHYPYVYRAQMPTESPYPKCHTDHFGLQPIALDQVWHPAIDGSFKPLSWTKWDQGWHHAKEGTLPPSKRDGDYVWHYATEGSLTTGENQGGKESDAKGLGAHKRAKFTPTFQLPKPQYFPIPLEHI